MPKEKDGTARRGRPPKNRVLSDSKELFLAMPAAHVQPVTNMTKRVCLGGRGREWATESLKLLETMLELDDAKLFLEPMDPLKYPEYYNIVHDPIDLSKIMLNFHGGSYSHLIQFKQDMQDMFDNYIKFFDDNKTETYHQVRRLCSWFDAEMSRIKTKFSNPFVSVSSDKPPVHIPKQYTPRVGSLEARILAIEAENKRIVDMCGVLPTSTGMRTPRMPTTTLPFTTRVPNSIVPTMASKTPLFRFCLSKNSHDSGYALKKVASSTASRPPQLYVFSNASSCSATGTAGSSSSGLMYVNAKWPTSSTNTSLSTAGPTTGSVLRVVRGLQATPRSVTANNGTNHSTTHADESQPNVTGTVGTTVMQVDITNIWFGTVRNKPVEPVVITEAGFSMMLKNGDKDTPFTISCDEIVRCAAYFGNARKHTLFLFVLPNCTRRLASLGNKYTTSSLIVMFLPALSQRQVTELVYLFWRMGRKSIFGDLFCEIDQKAALSLLSNIKPAIMSNVADRLKDVLESQLSPTLDSTQQPRMTAHGLPVLGHCYASSSVKSGFEDDDNNGGLNIVSAEDVDCKPQNLEELLANGATVFDGDRVSSERGTLPPMPARINSRKVNTVTVTRVAGKTPTKSSNSGKKRLRVNFRPSILKQKLSSGGSLGVRDHIVQNESDEMDDDETTEERDTIRSEQELVDGQQYTIIQWDANDTSRATATPPTGNSVSSPCQDDQPNDADDQPTETDDQPNDADNQLTDTCSDGENDLEIVCPNESEDDLTPDTQGGSDDNEDGVEDLVMTKEEINTRCPITQQIMKHPMKNKHCGHSYDRHGVEELIRHRGDKARCPVPGCSNTIPLKMNDIKQNYTLWQHINCETKRKRQHDSD